MRGQDTISDLTGEIKRMRGTSKCVWVGRKRNEYIIERKIEPVLEKIQNTDTNGFYMSTERNVTVLTNYKQHETRKCGTPLKSQRTNEAETGEQASQLPDW
jgi:hypothetical protein